MRKPTESRVIDFSSSDWLTTEQAMKHYQIGREGITQIATQAGALIMFGRRTRLYRPLIDEFLLKEYRVQN